MPIKLDQPLCPNCSRPMTELPAARKDQPELTIFKCSRCDLSYFTDDHVAVTGRSGSHYTDRVEEMATTKTREEVAVKEAAT